MCVRARMSVCVCASSCLCRPFEGLLALQRRRVHDRSTSAEVLQRESISREEAVMIMPLHLHLY